jgi:hypothetical protein
MLNFGQKIRALSDKKKNILTLLLSEKLFIRKVQQEPINCHKKWENDLETSIEDWHDIYSLSFCITKDTKLQNFQFKLLHRILPVKSFLYKCGLKETELCTFCVETKENLLHLFQIVI